jgi:hypothetical protein
MDGWNHEAGIFIAPKKTPRQLGRGASALVWGVGDQLVKNSFNYFRDLRFRLEQANLCNRTLFPKIMPLLRLDRHRDASTKPAQWLR